MEEIFIKSPLLTCGPTPMKKKMFLIERKAVEELLVFLDLNLLRNS